MNRTFKHAVCLGFILLMLIKQTQAKPTRSDKHRLKKQENNEKVEDDQAKQSMDYLNQNYFYGQNYEFNKVNGHVKTVQQDYDDKMKQSQLDYKQYLQNYRRYTQQQYQDNYNHMVGH